MVPFAGSLDGEVVCPPEVGDDARVECLECRERMGVRKSHYNRGTFVSRHFWHLSDACGYGESSTHVKMKSIVYSKMQNYPGVESVSFDDEYLNGRKPDVLVHFNPNRPVLGRGIAIECQHRHEDKDIENVEREYLEEGYSVLWLDESAFAGKDVDFSRGRTVPALAAARRLSQARKEAPSRHYLARVAAQSSTGPRSIRLPIIPTRLMRRAIPDPKTDWLYCTGICPYCQGREIYCRDKDGAESGHTIRVYVCLTCSRSTLETFGDSDYKRRHRPRSPEPPDWTRSVVRERLDATQS